MNEVMRMISVHHVDSQHHSLIDAIIIIPVPYSETLSQHALAWTTPATLHHVS